MVAKVDHMAFYDPQGLIDREIGLDFPESNGKDSILFINDPAIMDSMPLF